MSAARAAIVAGDFQLVGGGAGRDSDGSAIVWPVRSVRGKRGPSITPCWNVPRRFRSASQICVSSRYSAHARTWSGKRSIFITSLGVDHLFAHYLSSHKPRLPRMTPMRRSFLLAQ